MLDLKKEVKGLSPKTKILVHLQDQITKGSMEEFKGHLKATGDQSALLMLQGERPLGRQENLTLPIGPIFPTTETSMPFHRLAAVLNRGEVLKDWKKEEVDYLLSSHRNDPLLVNFHKALYFLASTLLIGIPWQGHQPPLEVALTSGPLLLLLVLDHLVDHHRPRCRMC